MNIGNAEAGSLKSCVGLPMGEKKRMVIVSVEWECATGEKVMYERICRVNTDDV